MFLALCPEQLPPLMDEAGSVTAEVVAAICFDSKAICIQLWVGVGLDTRKKKRKEAF